MLSYIRVFLFFFMFVYAAPASAEETYAACEEAKAFAEKAAAFLKEYGAEQAFAAFNDRTGPFRDRDLYIFVYGENGTTLVHPLSPSSIGRSIYDYKDVMGYAWGKAMMKIQDTGWVHYKYPSPYYRTLGLDKKSYIIKVGRYRVGCGCYKARMK